MLMFRGPALRYTEPAPPAAAVRSVGPGRARLVLEIYNQVHSAGGTVWEMEARFARLDCSVELPGGEDHPAAPVLQALLERANRTCEACGAPAEVRTSLLWWRCVCDAHYAAFRDGAFWRDLYAPWWPRRLPERPDLWPPSARQHALEAQ